ncbi:MAG: hypothetical protein AAGI38_20130 [Bacteroidota bacterium]
MLPLKALIWENELDHAELYEYHLEKLGYEVICVNAEEELVEISLQIRPAVILIGNCSSASAKEHICMELNRLGVNSTAKIICTFLEQELLARNCCEGTQVCVPISTKIKDIMSLVNESPRQVA